MRDRDSIDAKREQTIGTWLFSGMSAKTVVLAVCSICATYYVLAGRVSVDAERLAATNIHLEDETKSLSGRVDGVVKRQDSMRDQLQDLHATTVPRETFQAEINRIDQTQLLVEGALIAKGQK